MRVVCLCGSQEFCPHKQRGSVVTGIASTIWYEVWQPGLASQYGIPMQG